MIAIPSAWLGARGTIGKRPYSLRRARYRACCGPGTFVTTRLNIRCRATRREAWLMIVGGANPLRSVSTCAPTAWPPDLRSPMASLIRSIRDTGSCRPTGSGGTPRPQLEPVGVHAATAQVTPERAGHGGEHHVVHRAAERVLDRLHVGEL